MPTAYVLMKCEEGAENRIMRNLSGSDYIRELLPTIGHYDLIAKVSSGTTGEMDEILRQIHSDEKVRAARVLTMNDL